MGCVFRHDPHFLRCHSARPATCSETGPQQWNGPITERRPRYGACSLAMRRRYFGQHLYTSIQTSWILVFICVFILSVCQTTLSESLAPPCALKAAENCNRHQDCKELTMGHTESPEFHQLLATTDTLWVFGYGSLVWKTGFDYDSRKIGYIDGFVRRFWQGDTTHRGTFKSPGRVATLEKNESEVVWGVAFKLVGRAQIESALEHLGMRECRLGGYEMHMVSFHSQEDNSKPTQTLVFVASPSNRNYLGQATIEELVDQIIASRGNAGHNVEYVIRLADFMRENAPVETADRHLYDLDSSLREKLLKRKIELNALLAMETTDYGYMFAKQGEVQEPPFTHETYPAVKNSRTTRAKESSLLTGDRDKSKCDTDSIDDQYTSERTIETDHNNNCIEDNAIFEDSVLHKKSENYKRKQLRQNSRKPKIVKSDIYEDL